MVTAKSKKSSAKPKPRSAVRPKARPKAKPTHPSSKSHAPSRKAPSKKPQPKALAKGGAKSAAKKGGASSDAPGLPPVPPRIVDGRRHVLSLSFLRDGDEFFARIEGNGGQITEFKNRALDQLLTLVASELEDLVE